MRLRKIILGEALRVAFHAGRASREFGDDFTNIADAIEVHKRPWGAEQELVYCYCRLPKLRSAPFVEISEVEDVGTNPATPIAGSAPHERSSVASFGLRSVGP